MLEAGGIIRHDVDLAREVEGQVVVAVEALVLARPVAEVGSGPAEVTAPLRTRDTAGVLSEPFASVA